MNNFRAIIQLKDAPKCVNKIVNLCGFVSEFSLPRKSQGTDYVSILQIVDETLTDGELSVNIFTRKLEDLPRINAYRDFIILYNVKIEEFNGRLFAVFNKNYSSFALFGEKSNIDFEPYQATPGFYLLEPDKLVVARTRHLSKDYQFSGGKSKYLLSLKDIDSEKDFDLICKVLHVEVVDDVCIFFVWDGNDTPTLAVNIKLEDAERNPIQLQIEPRPLPRHVLSGFPCIGTVLRVIAGKAHEKLDLHFKGVGKWVMIRHITCDVCSALWHGLLSSSSKIRFLSENDDSVLQCKRTYNEREMRKEGCVPYWITSPYFLTKLDHEDVPLATLMDLLAHSEVNTVVRCIVRVIAVCPAQVNDIFQQVGSDECRIRLTLEDPTARIHSLICDGEGTSQIKKLLGISELCDGWGEHYSPRFPPWIQCCIKPDLQMSYYICNTRFMN
ncbi:Protection of telomeres protein [Quillaja saponaria]|uniref:Protection of telomeres protein n=1 Tax=Quillaja saponaria TaxID=32244 RepID=A0AAD7PHU2_QUISA|nr:Protection of telomeres protein [Quillaja saponaria]